MEILGSGLHQEDSRLLWDRSIMEDRDSCQSRRPVAVIQQGEHEVCLRGQKRFMHWRRKWQPTPVFLPRESQGQGSVVGCCLWGRTESDTTEAT